MSEIRLSPKSRIAWAIASWTAALVVLLSATFVQYRREYDLRAQREQELESVTAVRAAMNAIVESETFGFIVVDRYGAVEFWNPALEQLTGRKASDVLGKNITEIMTPEVASVHAPMFAAMMRDRTKWGKLVVVENCALPTIGNGSAPIRVRAQIVPTVVGPKGVAQITQPQSVVRVQGLEPEKP